MATSQVDLTSVSLHSELVLRGGNLTDARAQESARAQYLLPNNHYHDALVALSCLFRPSAPLDDLAQEGAYRNATLSI